MTKSIYIPMIIGGIIGYKYAMKKREIDDLKQELERRRQNGRNPYAWHCMLWVYGHFCSGDLLRNGNTQ